MSEREPKFPVIYFDGECHLCNGFVRYIIGRDPEMRFRFSPLQSDYAKSRGFKIPKNPDGSLETVMLEEGDRILDYSSAVLRIVTKLGGWHRLFVVFYLIPKGIRDAIYRWIARRRYGIFGRSETCMVPGAGVHSRFLIE